MRNTKIFCMMAIVTCLGLGASGCGKYDYDSEQIYTKHKKACEASIDRANGVLYPALSADQIALQIENGELKSYEGQFLYEEGVCECDNTECAVGEVCYEFSDDTVKCVDYMCDEGERKCVENNGFALKFRCEDYKWKAEGFCSVGKCHENGIECAANSSNVMDIDVIEDKIDSECSNGICIEIGSNEFGRKAYMFMPCEEGKMRQDKQEICDYNCNDDEKQGDLGCVQCNINDNICEDDDNHLRACINGEFKRFMCENGCRDGACLEKPATGKCVNGSKMCDRDEAGAPVLKTCKNGVWEESSCGDGWRCEMNNDGKAECVVDADFDQDCTYLDKRCNENGYIEICQNKEWMNYKEYIKEMCPAGSTDCIADTSDGISSYCANDGNNNVHEWCEKKDKNYQYKKESCEAGSVCGDGECSGGGVCV